MISHLGHSRTLAGLISRPLVRFHSTTYFRCLCGLSRAQPWGAYCGDCAVASQRFNPRIQICNFTDHSEQFQVSPSTLRVPRCSGLHPFGFPSLQYGDCAQRPLDDKGRHWANIAVQSVIILRMTSQPTSNSSASVPLSPREGVLGGARSRHRTIQANVHAVLALLEHGRRTMRRLSGYVPNNGTIPAVPDGRLPRFDLLRSPDPGDRAGNLVYHHKMDLRRNRKMPSFSSSFHSISDPLSNYESCKDCLEIIFFKGSKWTRTVNGLTWWRSRDVPFSFVELFETPIPTLHLGYDPHRMIHDPSEKCSHSSTEIVRSLSSGRS
ncbi:hypothetical protein BJY01DRAFT_89617 [Aspergillus pseudoustus]|uniref:Uncharacterized protein n=1 Tax=Aspergillus pseudoustus TaxID=1810923 RepID=A0ABR4J1X0_9EURO